MINLDQIPFVNSDQRSQLALLAPGRSGKSCLLLGALALLREGISDGMYAKIADAAQAGEYQIAIENLIGNCGDERFPEATSLTRHYNLELFWSDHSQIGDLSLVDWRGQLLRSQGELSDIEANKAMLGKSDGFIVVIDVSALLSENDVQRAHNTAMPEIQEIIRLASEREGGDTKSSKQSKKVEVCSYTADCPLPVSIVLTKWDLVKKKFPNEDVSEIKSKVLEMLFRHCAGILRLPKVLSFICFSSLGDDIEASGSFAPVGVEYPLYFAAWREIHRRVFLPRNALEYARCEVTRIDERIEVIGKVLRKLKSIEDAFNVSKEKIAESRQKFTESRKANSSVEQISSSIDLLQRGYDREFDFFNGLFEGDIGLQSKLIPFCEEALSHEEKIKEEIGALEEQDNSQLVMQLDYKRKILEHVILPLQKEGGCAFFQGGARLKVLGDGAFKKAG